MSREKGVSEKLDASHKITFEYFSFAYLDGSE
jgi:hypothetical protein